jgi:hypothetical protein
MPSQDAGTFGVSLLRIQGWDSIPRHQKIWIFLYVGFVFAIGTGYLAVLFYLLVSVFRLRRDLSALSVGIVGATALPALAYGCYVGIRVHWLGESRDSFIESLGLGSRGRKLIFWLLSPVLVSIFAVVYSLPLSLGVLILSVPLGNAVARYAGYISACITFLSVVFAIITEIQLWKEYKKYFLD